VVKGPLPDYIYVVDEEEFQDGRQIVKQGGYGKWIWVILEGQVQVTKDTPNGPLPIAMMGEGSFLGTFSSFLFQEVVRSASLTTVGNVRLGLLDNERLATEYGALSPEFRGILVSLDRRLRKITDRAVELFLKKDSLTPLTKNKKIILKMGSTQEKLFVISEGEAMVMGNISKKHTPLMTLEKEDFFGYIPFLEIGQEPRSASVMASGDLKANTLDLESLQREYDLIPETFRNLINNISTNIAMTTRLAARLMEGK
jgi:CRP-like cAMP-binding protein